MAKIEEILALEQIENDIFRGIATETLLPRTFGGQVAGQALVSAVRTVDPRVRGAFAARLFPEAGQSDDADRLSRRPDPRRPLVLYPSGDRGAGRQGDLHDVGVVPRGGGPGGIEHQDTMPRVPMPEDLPDPDLVDDQTVRWARIEWAEWEFRFVPPEQMDTSRRWAAQQQVWFRSREALPDDPVFHVCTLAYMSDMTLLGSASVGHPDEKTQGASLDHAMWFMRPFRADDWLLYDQTSPPSAGFGRALTQGRIFDRNGNMVAAVVQEGLTRYLRDS